MPFIKRLAYASEVEFTDNFDAEGSVCVVTDAAAIYMPMKELIDLKGELERLTKDLEKTYEDKKFFESKLNNPGFVAKAPEKVVTAQKEQLAKVLEKIENLNKSLEDIKKQLD